jgi:hypothetical protein
MQQVLPGYQEKDKPLKPNIVVLTEKLMTLLYLITTQHQMTSELTISNAWNKRLLMVEQVFQRNTDIHDQ